MGFPQEPSCLHSSCVALRRGVRRQSVEVRMVRTVLAAAIVAATLVHVSAQEPALPDALGKAADYVAQYRLKASGLSVEEQLLLTELTNGRPVPRRLASDLVLINVQERLMGLRDPFSI